jgi:hypothetical protein
MIPIIEKGLKPIKPRQLDNEWTLKVYAAALLCLISLFGFSHWTHVVAARYRWSSSHTLRQLPGFQIALALIRLELKPLPSLMTTDLIMLKRM